MEALNQYRNRTNWMWDSLPPYGSFTTKETLTEKVNADGSFRSFYGDTTIFYLPEEMRSWLTALQSRLYEACGHCLAEPITPDTFHITLHDLANSPESMPARTAENREKAEQILSAGRTLFPEGIRVRSKCIFSMVNTSIVMGFEPAAEADCFALMTMHKALQSVVELNYPLTLHVTLAYYRPGVYDEPTLHALRNTFAWLGREGFEWTLSMDDLQYVTFDSMNNYIKMT